MTECVHVLYPFAIHYHLSLVHFNTLKHSVMYPVTIVQYLFVDSYSTPPGVYCCLKCVITCFDSLSFFCAPPPFQILNQFTDDHEIWYGRYVVRSHPKPMLLMGDNNIADARTCDMGATLAPLNLGA
jgi:hypothetical protein